MEHESENPHVEPEPGTAAWMPTEEPVMMPERESPFRRGYALPAWIVIILTVGLMVILPYLESEPEGTEAGDPLGVMLMQIQARAFVGMANSPLLASPPAQILSQAEEALNLGSVDQRLRFVVFAAELGGPAEARRVLDELDQLIQEELAAQVPPGESFEVTEAQEKAAVILHKLYDPAAADADVDDGASAPPEDPGPPQPALDALTDADRDLLKNELGWFGELALHPPGHSDTAARDEIVRPALLVFHVFVGALFGASVLGFLGFIGLVILLAVACMGSLRDGVQPGGAHHGLYAETFAVWMVLFVGMQLGAGVIAMFVPSFTLVLAMIAFFCSLVALAWPVVRGARWSVVRQDIGWTLGRAPAVEPLIGAAGYAMAIPLAFIGICCTLVLLLIQAGLAGEPGTFDSTAGPAHPIFLEIAGGGWWPRIQILLLAAVAAPIVEETMFRGVLYRHLRDATRNLGIWLSVLISAGINGFIFAVIHPQGWVAIPALMSLAFAFIIVREWRGTVIPAMIVHGISNGLLMSIVMFMAGA